MDTLILKNLKSLRRFHRLTRAEFATAVGVSESLVSLTEAAKRDPTAGYIARVCEAFHVEPNVMYGVDLAAGVLHYPPCECRATEGGDDGQP